jgi:hypothetical protein
VAGSAVNFAVASTVVLSAAGCATKPKPTTQPGETAPAGTRTRVESINQALTPPRRILPVKEGLLPLVYLVESATNVRVVDVQTGAILCDVPAKTRQIVSVSGQGGILVGDVQVRPGPLPGNRTFAIYVGTDELNTYSSERITVPEK